MRERKRKENEGGEKRPLNGKVLFQTKRVWGEWNTSTRLKESKLSEVARFRGGDEKT